MTDDTKPALWKVAEAADYYRVTPRTIHNWIAKGAIQVDRKMHTVRVYPPTSTTTTGK